MGPEICEHRTESKNQQRAASAKSAGHGQTRRRRWCVLVVMWTAIRMLLPLFAFDFCAARRCARKLAPPGLLSSPGLKCKPGQGSLLGAAATSLSGRGYGVDCNLQAPDCQWFAARLTAQKAVVCGPSTGALHRAESAKPSCRETIAPDRTSAARHRVCVGYSRRPDRLRRVFW